jgi:ketosteroid isomerase-like protein
LLRGLISTDVEFSWDCQRLGRTTAFLNYMAEDGFVLNRGLRGKAEARRAYESDPPGVRLTWGPTRVDVAAAGDLGYTLGIWHRDNLPGARKQLSGVFLTIWRRQPDGTWRWIADGGAAYPDEVIETLHRSFRASSAAPAEPELRILSAPDPAEVREKLLGLEREISRRAGERSVGEAYAPHLADQVFVFDGAAYTKDAAVAALTKPSLENRVSWEPAAVDLAGSGDLAWVWGIRRLERRANDSQELKVYEGLYVGIWKRQPNRDWKLVVHLVASPPPEAISQLRSTFLNAQPLHPSDSLRPPP